jgi:hypothetical protein
MDAGWCGSEGWMMVKVQSEPMNLVEPNELHPDMPKPGATTTITF